MTDHPAAPAARDLAAAGRLEDAWALLDDALPATDARGPARLPGALLAVEVGHLALALGQLEAAAAEAPDDPAVAAELAALRDELALAARPDLPAPRDDAPGPDAPDPDAPAPPPGPPPRLEDVLAPEAPEIDPDPLDFDPYLEPSDADLVRFVHAFGGREGVHARQWVEHPGTDKARTGYSPVHQPLTPALARAHLAGSLTLGSYLVRLDDTVVNFVLDLDLTRAAMRSAAGRRDRLAELRQAMHAAGLALRADLAALGLPCLLADSGFKGRHLWGLLDPPLPADLVHHAVRLLARHLAPASRDLSLEAFPKQGSVEPGQVGNLVKLPLGIHLRTGRRAVLLDDDGRAVPDPWPLLRRPPRIHRAALLAAMERLRARPEPAPPAPEPPPDADPAAPAAAAPRPPRRDAALPTDTEVDAHPELATLRAGCAVLDAIVAAARRERRLNHDRQVVLAHTVGHLADGPDLVNAVFAHCPEIPRHAWLGRRFRGHPASCARIRQRVSDISSRVPCHCLFDEAPGEYPNPLLHLPEDSRPRLPGAPAARRPEEA